MLQSKAVLNAHFYETSRFEQARVSHCLSLGTPVLAERGPNTSAPAAFDEAVWWFDARDPQALVTQMLRHPDFAAASRERLAAWREHDPMEAYADLLAFATGYQRGHAAQRKAATGGDTAWRPSCINLGSGKDYKPGWLNLDVIDRAEPDLVLDLGGAVSWPIVAPTRFGGELRLEAGSVDTIHANNVLEHVPDLPMLMGNLLALLKTGGSLEIEVPYERALTAWQDPTHLRAMNENSWLYYTSWFWYLGWFEHRFEIAASSWLDAQVQPCAQAQAAFMRLVLRKTETTPHERTIARTMRADFGGLPDDLPMSGGLPGDLPLVASPLEANADDAHAPASVPRLAACA